jgi:phosphatidylglycerol:prolipoprotein diacylglycerol transferase
VFPTLFDSAWIGLDGALAFRLPTYAVAIVVGFLAAATLAWRDAQHIGFDRRTYVDFALWMLIVGVLGSRAAHVLIDGVFFDYVHLCTDPFLLEGRALRDGTACLSNAQCMAEQARGGDIGAICRPEDGLCYPQTDCLRALKFWSGGMTVYGGLIGCGLVAMMYVRRHDVSLRKLLDLGGYGIPLGLAFGRLGCFASGCCFGDVCEVEAFGVQFPVGSTPYQHHYDNHYDALAEQWRAGVEASLQVWPTQLFSSAYALAIFLVAYFVVRPRKKYDGQVLVVTMALYAVARFSIEFLRADPRGGLLGLTTSQLISAGILATAVVLHRRWRAD